MYDYIFSLKSYNNNYFGSWTAWDEEQWMYMHVCVYTGNVFRRYKLLNPFQKIVNRQHINILYAPWLET